MRASGKHMVCLIGGGTHMLSALNSQTTFKKFEIWTTTGWTTRAYER